MPRKVVGRPLSRVSAGFEQTSPYMDRQGGPNWFKNWYVAPVIVDLEIDEVCFTPLYYTMAHFSKFIRSGAVRIGFEMSDDSLMMTAAQNPDGSVAVILLNMGSDAENINLSMGERSVDVQISALAIQTILVSP